MSTGIRILVPVKRVIDYAIKPRVNKTNTAIETAGIKHSMNPFDELSIEEAVRLRERSSKPPSPQAPDSKPTPPVAEIVTVSAGPAKSADVLRTALAMGADRAIHVLVEEDEALEPLAVAKLLREVVREEESDLVLLGKQSIDDDAGQTGQMLAGLLGWPQATQASGLRIWGVGGGGEVNGEGGKGEGYTAEVEKEVDGGSETVRARLPMVVTADLRLNEPRYASLPNIMKAKKKPFVKKTLGDYKVELGRRMKTLRVEEPPVRQGGGKVEDVDGLIGRLKELGAL